MPINLKVLLIITAIILLIVVFTALKKGRIPLKYSLVWLLPVGLLLIIAIMPSTLWKFTNLIGFQTISNFVVGVMFVILFFVCISLTIIVSGQKTKITLMIQEISLLKKQVNDSKKGEDNHND